MIDTHSHLLPFIDHGSPDLKTTLLMAREAAAAGVETVVCTPHLYELDPRLVARAREVVDQVREALGQAGVALRLLLGFEVSLTVAAMADSGTLRSLCIEGSDKEGSSGALLIEMPFQEWPLFLEETVFRLTSDGFIPLLAHPERNDRVQRDPEVLTACFAAGAVAQGTAGSLSPLFRRDSLRAFRILLSQGRYSLLASDAHADTKYTWSPASVLAELEGRVSPASLALLTKENPARVLDGRRPFPVSPTDGGKRAGIYSRATWRKKP